MSRQASIYAFSPNVLTDGVRKQLADENKKIRPVMSRGQVIAPLAFFEKGLGAEAGVSGGEIVLTLAGHTLRAVVDEKTYSVNGENGSFSVPVRKEKDYLCLPAVETARALGLFARQYGQLAVVADEDVLEQLEQDDEARNQLIRKTMGAYNAAYFTAEDFRKGRDAWRRNLCGDEKTNDLSIPGMKNLLEMRDQDCEDLRSQMNHGPDKIIIFGTNPPTLSRDLEDQYVRVLRIAQAYGTIGCRNYKSKEVLADLMEAMEWLHDNMYGAKVLSDESYRSYRAYDWWHWYVGGACPMMDIVMILEDDLTREQINKFLLPMSFIRTQMRVELKPALAMSRIIPLTPLALLTEDRALLQAVYVDEVSLLEEYDEGDNMRRDWCCMSHGMPYNITYGGCNLDRVARLLQVLDDTPLAFPVAKRYNLMNMARYTFAPTAYRGRTLTLMNGRYMQGTEMHTLGGLRTLYGLFGDEEDTEISQMIHRNNTEAVRRALISTYETGTTLSEYQKINVGPDHPYSIKTHIASYAKIRDALVNPKYDTEPYTLGYRWYSGDSCVQFRNEYMVSLRMNSKRSPGYESINGQNGDGWYTGDGMLYMYTPDDPAQYSIKWWKNVDKHLMPGTTVDARVRESMFFDRAWRSSQEFVGGVSLEGQYITASMDYESFHCEVDEKRPDRGYGRSWPLHKCTLTAKKSWFMLDKAVAAIGTAVNADDGYAVRTIVANQLMTEGLAGVLVNGEPLAEREGEYTREDVERIYIPKAGGYVFPKGGKVTIRVRKGEDGWVLAFWLEHGVNPKNGSYVYILLPNATEEETAAYDACDIEIAENGEKVQAVREKHSGLTGIVFREAGSYAGITADQPMIVMMEEKNGRISLTACDPTQERESFGLSVEGTGMVVSRDKRMTAEAAADGVKLNVFCDSSKGRGYSAVLEMK